jgi:hypothetical protein
MCGISMGRHGNTLMNIHPAVQEFGNLRKPRNRGAVFTEKDEVTLIYKYIKKVGFEIPNHSGGRRSLSRRKSIHAT